MRVLVLLAVAALVAVLSDCAGARGKPAGERLAIYLTTADTGVISQQAAAVRARKAGGPVLWAVTGNLFEDRRAACLTDGAATIRLLNAAGVDAVLLTPEWLEFGTERLGQLVNAARFYVLGANLSDSTGMPLGHPFMVRRCGTLNLGLVGLWLDSLGLTGRMKNVRSTQADFTARLNGPVLRQRVDLLGVLAGPARTVSGWGADFVLGVDAGDATAVPLSADAFKARRLDITHSEGRVLRVTVAEQDMTQTGSDTLVQAAADSIARVVDALAAEQVTNLAAPLTAEELGRSVVTGSLESGEADVFLSDGPLARTAAQAGILNRGTLIDALQNPGRLALIELSGVALKTLAGEKTVTMDLPRGQKLDKLTPGRIYKVATTIDFLRRHRQLADRGFTLTARQAWELASIALGKPKGKR